jgi:hypothetical protein
MCQYFSCIITKDLKVHWTKKTTAHEEIIAEAKLEDKKLENRDFVRIEISLKDTTKVTRNPDDWKFKVDEEDTLPEWFIENQKKVEKACWKAWEESVQIQLGLNDENKGELEDTLVFLHGSSSAVLNDSSSAELNDSSSAELYDSSSAVLHGSSSAELHGSSSAELHDWSSAVLYGSSSAELYDSSSAELKSKISIAISNNKIFVHKEATIKKTCKVKAADARSNHQKNL